MRSFYFIRNGVVLVWNNNTSTTVYFNKNSGKVYYRYKINTIAQIKHPGIFLGTDANRNEIWVHNHYRAGGAHVTYGNDFKQGMEIYLYHEMCSNAPKQVIESALNQVLAGEAYHPIQYNCQTFANQACHNQRKSNAVENATTGFALFGLALFFIALLGGDNN